MAFGFSPSLGVTVEWHAPEAVEVTRVSGLELRLVRPGNTLRLRLSVDPHQHTAVGRLPEAGGGTRSPSPFHDQLEARVLGVRVQVAKGLSLAHEEPVLDAPHVGRGNLRVDEEVAPAGKVLPVEETDTLRLGHGGRG